MGNQGPWLRFKSSKSLDSVDATRLFCYVDASYASHVDSKSQSGYCFYLGNHLSMFFSRTFKQCNVTMSSTECENAAAVEETKKIIWFCGLLAELGFPQLEPIIVYADNNSMITLANDYSGNYKCLKHYVTQIDEIYDRASQK